MQPIIPEDLSRQLAPLIERVREARLRLLNSNVTLWRILDRFIFAAEAVCIVLLVRAIIRNTDAFNFVLLVMALPLVWWAVHGFTRRTFKADQSRAFRMPLLEKIAAYRFPNFRFWGGGGRSEPLKELLKQADLLDNSYNRVECSVYFENKTNSVVHACSELHVYHKPNKADPTTYFRGLFFYWECTKPLTSKPLFIIKKGSRSQESYVRGEYLRKFYEDNNDDTGVVHRYEFNSLFKLYTEAKSPSESILLQDDFLDILIEIAKNQSIEQSIWFSVVDRQAFLFIPAETAFFEPIWKDSELLEEQSLQLLYDQTCTNLALTEKIAQFIERNT